MNPKCIKKVKGIFYQLFSPHNLDSDKRPFVIDMQTKEMLERAKNITLNFAWVIDSTFKINHWSMSFFLGICPNENGLGLPVFHMFCSDNKKQKHVETTL